MGKGLFKIIREKFTVRMFFIFTAAFFLVCTVVTVLYVRYQTNILSENLVHSGRLLSEILSHNSRLGVFSENEELLKEIVNGLYQQENVRLVSIFNQEGKLLLEKSDPKHAPQEPFVPYDSNVFEKIKNETPPVFMETEDYLGFWSPVRSSSPYVSEDAFLIEENDLTKGDNIIGFALIVLGKSALSMQITALVYRIIFTAIAFWVVGSVSSFFIVNKVTNPLVRLTRAVEKMGRTGEISKVPIETSDEIGNLAIAFNDMSDALKKREKEKQQLEKQLTQVQKMEAIGTLAGGIAHDFNNIIGLIIGFSELALVEAGEDESMLENITEILNASHRATGLVKQILTFSRQDQQEKTPLEVKSIIKEVLKLLRPSLPSSIKVHQNIDPNCGLVLSDPTAIHQIMMNLCTNAVHSMKDQIRSMKIQRGILEVSLSDVEIEEDFAKTRTDLSPGWYQKLSIKDTGHGIDPGIMDRIFDPFFTTKGLDEGTGMGLSVVHGIVKDHNGTIIVDSAPGEGTRFDVYLPLIDMEEAFEEVEFNEELPFGNETILVVDDEKPLAESTKQNLEDLGYTVFTEVNGIDALEAFEKEPKRFNLVITDMTMPHMSGMELSKEILKIRPDIPIILCTGFNNLVTEESATALGIKEFIMKPVSKKKLAVISRKLLDQHQHHVPSFR